MPSQLTIVFFIVKFTVSVANETKLSGETTSFSCGTSTGETIKSYQWMLSGTTSILKTTQILDLAVDNSMNENLYVCKAISESEVSAEGSGKLTVHCKFMVIGNFDFCHK